MSDIHAPHSASPEESEQLTPSTLPVAEEAPAEEPLESEVVDELTTWQSSIDTRSPFVRQVAADYPAWLERTFEGRAIFYPYTEQRFGVFLDGQRIQWGRMNKHAGVAITLPLTKDGPAIERLKDLPPHAGFFVGPRGSQFTLQNDGDYAIFQEALRLIAGLPATEQLYDPAALAAAIAKFKQHYTSFGDALYYNEERFYKEHFARRMHKLLSQEQLGALIASGDFEAAKTTIKQTLGGSVRTPSEFRQQNNLLGQWDRYPILEAPAEPLARRLYALLYGEETFEVRFDAWVELLSAKKPGVWPAATYFLMLHDPEQFIFVKPEVFKAALNTLGVGFTWQTRPDAAVYHYLLRLARQLRTDLTPLGARDMIDVQSFLWRISYRTDASVPKAWIFQSNPQYYDLAGALAELEEIDWVVRQYATEVKAGDTVYLWEAGADAGLLASAQVMSDPAVLPEMRHDERFYRDASQFSAAEQRVRLRVEQVLNKRLHRNEFQKEARLSKMTILRNAQGTNFRLTPEETAALASLIAAEGDDDLENDGAEPMPVIEATDPMSEATGVEAGLSGQDQIRIALQLMEQQGGSATMQQIYPAVEGRMGGRMLSEAGCASLRYFVNTVAVKAGYIHPHDPQRPGWHITDAGRSLLALPPDEQQATLDTLDNEVLRDEVGDGRIAAPDPLDGRAFVLIHKSYGPDYRFTSNAGGSPRRLIRALEEWLQRGKPVYAILYRPSPYKAFAAWARVEYAEPSDDRRTWTVRFAMYPFEPPVRVHRLIGALSWLDPARNLAVAFRGISIRPIPSSDFHTILAVAGAAIPPVDADEPALDEPPEPVVFAAANAAFWRFNVSREHWATAHRHGLLGWEGVSTSQSGQRLRQIRAGDRIVAYIPGGQIGSIGMVTRAYQANDPQGGSSAELFGGGYLQRIAVLWATSPSEPIHVLDELKDDAYAQLFQRFKDPNPIGALTREEYAEILSILGVDDVEPPTRLPRTWTRLGDYIAFAQSIDNEELSMIDLGTLVDASHTPSLDPIQDEEQLLAELRQLRLLAETGDDLVRQRYVDGERQTLTRLSVLALLVEDAQQPGTFELPARTILPRIRNAQSPCPVEQFAPEFGAEGELLLSWYAEAGLVTLVDDTWQMAPGALDPLPGNEPAAVMYREVLKALLDELDNGAPFDLPHVHLDEPLSASPDLPARMAELGRELLIDSAVIKRVYRSLMAGRHVVLSGPPGTGKTELARLLPTLLWREAPQRFQRLTLDPDQPPAVAVAEERHGYAPIVATATEDWGVRDVVGGIGPRLDGASGALSYTIEYGVLTRVVLRHFAGTEGGRRLPPSGAGLERRDSIGEDGRRYRGTWLVIDEFTRAPIDAAFGSLLTTLGGGKRAWLAVPTPAGDLRELPLPRDFRIIGTLNSFDRHFLNQMSEAMKRRFDFIDVLPPGPDAAAYEQGLAALQALDRLRSNGFTELGASGGWPSVIAIKPTTDAEGLPRYVLGDCMPAATAALDSFWRIFSAIRVFRQLGTAQVVAVYTNLFAGVLASAMSWDEALDTALADALADQLQVLSRDEQRTLDALLDHAGSRSAFVSAIQAILRELPPGRRAGYLYALQERAAILNSPVTIPVSEDANLDESQITAVFMVGDPLSLPTPSTFRRRLRDLIGERGL